MLSSVCVLLSSVCVDLLQVSGLTDTCIGLTCVILLVLFTALGNDMLFTHLILSIFFSFSHYGPCFEFTGRSPEQLIHLAGLSHTPDGPQCSGLPQLQHTSCLPHFISW